MLRVLRGCDVEGEVDIVVTTKVRSGRNGIEVRRCDDCLAMAGPMLDITVANIPRQHVGRGNLILLGLLTFRFVVEKCTLLLDD